ncbi:hypothetical protein X778_27100 [Pseudomonas aeruginosa VRFPA07]|nr:hypothetical protein X778_27100 [Pseudomonas aeruginosa VRFPA07]
MGFILGLANDGGGLGGRLSGVGLALGAGQACGRHPEAQRQAGDLADTGSGAGAARGEGLGGMEDSSAASGDGRLALPVASAACSAGWSSCARSASSSRR